MGGSHGGTTTLTAITRPGPSGGGGFAAGVALYPRCATTWGPRTAYRPAAPLLILIGDKDDGHRRDRAGS